MEGPPAVHLLSLVGDDAGPVGFMALGSHGAGALFSLLNQLFRIANRVKENSRGGFLDDVIRYYL